MNETSELRSAERREQLAAGRRLVEQQSGLQFVLGDLALEVAPVPRDGERLRPLDHEGLAMLAEKIGIRHARLEEYRRVAAAWPRERRAEGVSWSVHAILSHHEDRFRAIKSPPVDPRTGERHWTCDAASGTLRPARGE